MSTQSAIIAGPTAISLPPVLDIAAAAELKRELLEVLASGNSVNVDAGAVQRVTTPCLQVLASAARSIAQAGGGRMRLHSMKADLAENIRMLGLAEILNIGEGER